MNDRLLSMLGLARRAGRLSVGHDASIEAIVRNKAKLCVICSDASERLKKEMRHACSYGGKDIMCLTLNLDILTLSGAIGTKAAVLTVNDEGFAKKIASLHNEQSSAEGTQTNEPMR